MAINLLERYKRDLALKGFSVRTRKIYFDNLIKFLRHIKTNPEQVTKKTIKDYLYFLIKDRNLSLSTLKQARCAIRYFISQTLSKSMEVENIPCPKKPNRLPAVFSVEEVAAIIKAAENPKHKALFMLAYSAGLRVSEIANLKIQDIQRNIMRILVRQAKGQKDRYTILSALCLTQLEKYWKIYRPKDYLFHGYQNSPHITNRAIQHAYLKAKRKAGITREGGIHSFRHSFATHMLESGCGIFQLQKFLGHKHLKTTLIYAHIREENIIAQSPLDFYADKFTSACAIH